MTDIEIAVKVTFIKHRVLSVILTIRHEIWAVPIVCIYKTVRISLQFIHNLCLSWHLKNNNTSFLRLLRSVCDTDITLQVHEIYEGHWESSQVMRHDTFSHIMRGNCTPKANISHVLCHTLSFDRIHRTNKARNGRPLNGARYQIIT